MSEQIVETSSQPTVVISAMGQLYIKGWDQNRVRVRSADDRLKLDQADDTVNIHSDDDLKYKAYIEYGRKFMELIKEIGHPYNG